jgi:SAM-dependent methyltransferase
MKIDRNQTQYFGRDLEAMSFANNYHLWILEEFRPFFGKHLLEVGAGTGDFSELLLQTQPDSLTVVEPSKNMFPLLEETLKHRPNTEWFNAFFGDVYQSLSTQPNTIIYVNVLEHISEDKSELTYVYQALPVGGHVCIFVPALQWLYGTADMNVGHVRRYYKKPLEAIVESVGFEIVKSNYFDIAGIIPWWILFCLFKSQSIKANQVSVYDKVVVPIMRRIEKTIPIPIGKNIVMVGKKMM